MQLKSINRTAEKADAPAMFTVFYQGKILLPFERETNSKLIHYSMDIELCGFSVELINQKAIFVRNISKIGLLVCFSNKFMCLLNLTKVWK